MRSRLRAAYRGVVTGGNKNTPYCHALFAYNQIVKSKCDISGIRFEKKTSAEVFHHKKTS